MSKIAYWYCPHCKEELSPSRVTYQELCDTYGHLVGWIEDINIDRLRELVEADMDGRCVVLPCKVGDTAWKIKAVFSYYSKPMEDRVDRIIISDKEILVCCTSGTKFSTDSIGKTVFLTRAEAEAALKEVAKNERQHKTV